VGARKKTRDGVGKRKKGNLEYLAYCGRPAWFLGGQRVKMGRLLGEGKAAFNYLNNRGGGVGNGREEWQPSGNDFYLVELSNWKARDGPGPRTEVPWKGELNILLMGEQVSAKRFLIKRVKGE